VRFASGTDFSISGPGALGLACGAQLPWHGARALAAWISFLRLRCRHWLHPGCAATVRGRAGRARLLKGIKGLRSRRNRWFQCEGIIVFSR